MPVQRVTTADRRCAIRLNPLHTWIRSPASVETTTGRCFLPTHVATRVATRVAGLAGLRRALLLASIDRGMTGPSQTGSYGAKMIRRDHDGRSFDQSIA